jgi:FixJ family two-component response regulator
LRNLSDAMRVAATVHVVGDSESVRQAISALLESAGYVVKLYESVEAFLAGSSVPGDTPTVVLADSVLPAIDALALAARLKSADSTLPVVFLCPRESVPASVRAMTAGTVDFLEKPVHEAELREVVGRAVARSRERIVARQRIADLHRRYASLTPRERQVLSLVVSGLLNKQVASELRIGEKTVKVHRARLVRKLGARSLPELVRIAWRLGVATTPPPADLGDGDTPGGPGGSGPAPTPR